MNKRLKELAKKNKAFTLFVSLLVSALLLAVGFSIGNILIKQLTLATSGSGSQVAFYAADSAAECALYWDRKNSEGFSTANSPFGTSTVLGLRIVCGTGLDNGSSGDGEGLVYGFNKICNDGLCGLGATAATSSFYVDTTNPRDPLSRSCAYVTIAKVYNSLTGIEDTTIDARGYNSELVVDRIAGAGYTMDFQNPFVKCNLSRPKTVERGLTISY